MDGRLVLPPVPRRLPRPGAPGEPADGPASSTLTLVPSSNRYCPSTTTVCPALNPLEIKAQGICIRLTVTGVNFATRLEPSPLTVKT